VRDVRSSVGAGKGWLERLEPRDRIGGGEETVAADDLS
jgi:hypothetical protein